MRGSSSCCRSLKRRNQHHRQPPSPTLHRPHRLPFLLPLILHVGLRLQEEKGPDNRVQSSTTTTETLLRRQLSRRQQQQQLQGGTLRRVSGSGEKRVRERVGVGSRVYVTVAFSEPRSCKPTC